jgi:hypothetical protein
LILALVEIPWMDEAAGIRISLAARLIFLDNRQADPGRVGASYPMATD